MQSLAHCGWLLTRQMLVSERHAYLLLGSLLATIKAINLMRLVGLKDCGAFIVCCTATCTYVDAAHNVEANQFGEL